MDVADNNYRKIQRDKSIYRCQHFYWREVCKPNQPLPTNQETLKRIVDLAGYLELVRVRLGGKPLYITSWYRDPDYNRRVGGSTASRHLYGDAVDFYCNHLTPKQILNRLNQWHGAKGGLSAYSRHVHLDIRGHRARW